MADNGGAKTSSVRNIGVYGTTNSNFFYCKNLNTADFVFFDREFFLGRDLPPFATSYAQVTLTDCSSRLAPTGAGAV